jgi:hypothetical protein
LDRSDPFTTTRVVKSRTGDRVELRFTWHGGAYIDVARVGGRPSEVINVWDYYEDAPRIERTADAFMRRVDEWIADYPRDSLVHDVMTNWTY